MSVLNEIKKKIIEHEESGNKEDAERMERLYEILDGIQNDIPYNDYKLLENFIHIY